MMMSWHENTFHITGPLWGESTSQWWIPLTKGPAMLSFGVFFVVSLKMFLRSNSRDFTVMTKEFVQMTAKLT